jgi:hypothetical protein
LTWRSSRSDYVNFSLDGDSDSDDFSAWEKQTGPSSPSIKKRTITKPISIGGASRSLSFQNILEIANTKEKVWIQRNHSLTPQHKSNRAYSASKSWTITIDQFGVREDTDGPSTIITKEIYIAMKKLKSISDHVKIRQAFRFYCFWFMEGKNFIKPFFIVPKSSPQFRILHSS